MFPATQVLGGGRKRTEVLSGMIVWNVLVLVLLVLAVCVQGRGGATPSDTSSHLVLRRSPQGESVKKDGVGSPELEKSAAQPTITPQSAQDGDSGEPQVSKATPKSTEKPEEKKEETQEGKGGSGDTPPVPENKDGNNTTKEDHGLYLISAFSYHVHIAIRFVFKWCFWYHVLIARQKKTIKLQLRQGNCSGSVDRVTSAS